MILFLFFCLFFPIFLIWAEPRLKIVKWLSPIIICYAAGLLLANFPGIEIPSIATDISEVAVPLAIPLLLISTNIIRWIKGAKGAILSFVLCVIAVTVMAALGAFVFEEQLTDSWKLSGMIMGVYTGGTPNMSGIGLSLEVPEETFILMNASDLILGAIYLLFLLTLAKPVLGKILPEKRVESDDEIDAQTFGSLPKRQQLINLSIFLGLAFLILGAAVGISIAISGKMEAVIIILTVTSLGIGLSFIEKIKTRIGSYQLGEYFLLVFCLALGSLADISQLASAASSVLSFTAFVMLGSIILHVLLAAVFRLDRDTVIITSVAGIYGPAFVGPVAKSLKNKSIILTGMTTGLIGYAIGNYLGIGVAMLLKNWF